ncbi:MAG: hypothetical protein ABI425_03795 [Patescibacteria group bacterium]
MSTERGPRYDTAEAVVEIAIPAFIWEAPFAEDETSGVGRGSEITEVDWNPNSDEDLDADDNRN